MGEGENGIVAEAEKQQEKCNKKCVTVLFFARARELVGASETILTMESGSSTTVSDCVDAIIKEFPGLEEISSCMIVALNQTYVDFNTLVKDGDELALIPPISGG